MAAVFFALADIVHSEEAGGELEHCQSQGTVCITFILFSVHRCVCVRVYVCVCVCVRVYVCVCVRVLSLTPPATNEGSATAEAKASPTVRVNWGGGGTAFVWSPCKGQLGRGGGGGHCLVWSPGKGQLGGGGTALFGHRVRVNWGGGGGVLPCVVTV